MSYQVSNNPETIAVQLSPERIAVLTQRAQALEMDVSQYIAHILKDELTDPWRQPLPSEVEERYKKDYQTFLKEEKQGQRKTYYSAEKYTRDVAV